MKTSHGMVLDGFVRNSSSSGNSKAKSHKITGNSNLFKPKAVKTKLTSTAQSVHKRAQRSQTLMRSAVTKPQKIQTSTPKKAHAIKPQASNIDETRTSRVQTISKNSHVRRFGHVFPKAKSNHQPQKATQTNEAFKKAAAPKKSTSSKAVVHKPAPSMIISASHQQLERLLDEALIKADAHKKAMNGQLANRTLWQKIKGTPRWVTVSAGLLVIASVTGFYAWYNIPQVSVKVAGSRADVKAEVPSYVPSGFNFVGPVSYTNDSVDIKYKSKTDSSKTFVVSQKKSNLSNKSLEDTVVPKDAQLQTLEASGKTLYMYNDSTTWVDGGTQFTINGSATLGATEAQKIAEGF